MCGQKAFADRISRLYPSCLRCLRVPNGSCADDVPPRLRLATALLNAGLHACLRLVHRTRAGRVPDDHGISRFGIHYLMHSEEVCTNFLLGYMPNGSTITSGCLTVRFTPSLAGGQVSSSVDKYTCYK